MKKANPAAVGAFVLGAVALVLVGVVALGSGSLFRPTQRFALFFDGSVNGLDVGSPVKIRGVDIGKVDEISALTDMEQASVVTEVVIEIDPTRFKRVGEAMDTLAAARLLVDHGLRARLEVNSLVTGQLYVGLDFYPGTPARLTGRDETTPELPTIPSMSEEVQSTVRELAARIQKLPLEEMATNLNGALAGIEKTINSPDLQAALAQLDETVTEAREVLAETRRTVADARRLVTDVDTRIEPVADSATRALDQARDTLATVQGAVEPGADVRQELTQALMELTEAARAIATLADFVERNPNSLVFGRKPGGDQ